jgi:hypothetical protein
MFLVSKLINSLVAFLVSTKQSISCCRIIIVTQTQLVNTVQTYIPTRHIKTKQQHTNVLIYLLLCSPFAVPWRLFSFLIFYTASRTSWTADQPFARPLPTHRTTQPQTKRAQTCLERDSNPRSQRSSERRHFMP